MADINVAVVVDTINIQQSNVSSTVVLLDDNGDHDDTPGNSQTFDIHAGTNQTIKFTAYSMDGTTAVTFDSFVDENSVSGFVDLPSSGNDWTGRTNSEILPNTEYFTINFTVDGKGSFSLDPELQVDHDD